MDNCELNANKSTTLDNITTEMARILELQKERADAIESAINRIAGSVPSCSEKNPTAEHDPNTLIGRLNIVIQRMNKISDSLAFSQSRLSELV